MKKNRIVILWILIMLVFSGCSPDKSNHNLKEESWREAYAEFLGNFPGLTDYNHSEFALRDLDNDGMEELIIIQCNEVDGILSVYSYDGSIYKTGEYSDAKIGVAGLRFSDNLMFPGLFNEWWGGSIEHYGYLTVKDGRLIYEYLWYMDHTTEEWEQIEVSDNKQLINESIIAFSSYEDIDNLLEMYLINDDNISEVFDSIEDKSTVENESINQLYHFLLELSEDTYMQAYSFYLRDFTFDGIPEIVTFHNAADYGTYYSIDSINEKYELSDVNWQYSLIDLDGDNIEELLIQIEGLNTNNEVENTVQIFHYYAGKIYLWGNMSTKYRGKATIYNNRYIKIEKDYKHGEGRNNKLLFFMYNSYGEYVKDQELGVISERGKDSYYMDYAGGEERSILKSEYEQYVAQYEGEEVIWYQYTDLIFEEKQER